MVLVFSFIIAHDLIFFYFLTGVQSLFGGTGKFWNVVYCIFSFLFSNLIFVLSCFSGAMSTRTN